ncbi:hypothetical protein NUZ5A_50366 [Candidatus Nitrosotenuis uzonensis]|uniref:Uncharacterized protein n=1 Tax=Candidatus Nitrosotenuis uzonensis TaxID=1407055 RepID=A0A812F0C9_9ARCH|nr:hypothetical protein NUZ5A_50366 [Candidatus Nitrosotenuis uzonensis]
MKSVWVFTSGAFSDDFHHSRPTRLGYDPTTKKNWDLDLFYLLLVVLIFLN